MKVLEGQSTVSPRTPANSSAARAPPAQLERPRLGSLFHSAQRRSKASSIGPSDHRSESSTSVQSSNRRARSRWSNPIANLIASGRVVSADPTMAPWWVWYRRACCSGRRAEGAEEVSSESAAASDRPSRIVARLRSRGAMAGEPATRTVPATDTAIAVTRATLCKRRPLPSPPKTSGASNTGTTTWTVNIVGAMWVAGAPPQGAHSLSSARPSEAAGWPSETSATTIVPAAPRR